MVITQYTIIRAQSTRCFCCDFKSETGYSNSPDGKKNRLGTTKHILAVYNALKDNPKKFKRLKKQCPFVEIFLDPLNNGTITWFYPHPLPEEVKPMIEKYFGNNNHIQPEQTKDFLLFLDEVNTYEGQIVVRPEVGEKIDSLYELDMLKQVEQNYEIPYDQIDCNAIRVSEKGNILRHL